MTSDTYSEVLNMAVILLGVILLFGTLWLLMRKCGLGPRVPAEPCGEEVPGGVDQPQKAAAKSQGVEGSPSSDQPVVNTGSEHPAFDVAHSPAAGALSPSQRIVNVARRTSIAVGRAVKKETDAMLQALSSGADVMQIPSDKASLKSEGLPTSGKESKPKSMEGTPALDKEDRAEDIKRKKRGSSLSKDSQPGQTFTKENYTADCTTEKPMQIKDDDARKPKVGNVEPQSENGDGAAQLGQPLPQPTDSKVEAPEDGAGATAIVTAVAREQLQAQQEGYSNAGPGSNTARAQPYQVQDVDVVTSAELQSPKKESRRKKSKKRSTSAGSSANQSLAQSEVKSDARSHSSMQKRKSSRRSSNKTQH